MRKTAILLLALAAGTAGALVLKPDTTGGMPPPRYRMVTVPNGPRCLVLYWRPGDGLAVSCDWEAIRSP